MDFVSIDAKIAGKRAVAEKFRSKRLNVEAQIAMLQRALDNNDESATKAECEAERMQAVRDEAFAAEAELKTIGARIKELWEVHTKTPGFDPMNEDNPDTSEEGKALLARRTELIAKRDGAEKLVNAIYFGKA